MSIVKRLYEANLLTDSPKWLTSNVMFEGMVGSFSYGVSNDMSDIDVVGFCIPPKEIVFPHLAGEIIGFGNQIQRFDLYQKHHIDHRDKKYDISIYSIVKFFQLTMENNPNMLDTLFIPRRRVLHSTSVYEHVRENKELFLHKGCWQKFRGYSFSQLSKIKKKSNSSNPKRKEAIGTFGYDVKFAYHLIRLLLEVEQILVEQTLDIERNSNILKTVRNGEWSFDELLQWFSNKEKSLEIIYANSKLRDKPEESKIKKLLLECLEIHYGDLSSIVKVQKDTSQLIQELEYLIEKYK